MSEPDVETVISKSQARRVAVQADKPTLRSRARATAGEVDASDPRVADLMTRGLSEVEAVKLVADLERMW